MNRTIIALIVYSLFAIVAHADTCPTEEYKKQLSKIGSQDVNAVVQAANELLKIAKDKSDPCKDKLMHEFRSYYYTALSTYGKKTNVGEWKYPIADSERLKFERTISSVGWSLKETEGIYYLGDTGGWFEKKFDAILTPPFKKYLNIRTKEIRQGFSEDAGLLISWEQIRERISVWEQFLKQHPDFVEKPDIQYYLTVYIRTFLTGMDNSRIHDFNSNQLRPDVKGVYEKFIRENRDSAYYSMVKDYYEMLKNNQFNVPDDINGYLKKRGYDTMLGVQPPTY